MEPIDVLGCRLDPLDADEAAAQILAFARERRGAQVVTLGTEMVVMAQHDAAFRALLNRCELSLCDTVGVLAAARRRGADLNERVTGVELVERLCAAAAREGLPVYFLGGAAGVAEDAAAILELRYPGLNVVGTRDGFFDDAEAADVAAGVRASGAQLLFVGMGSPRQEHWLADHLSAAGAGVGIGVGGSFDVLSGRLDRAPEVVRNLGMEWFYRLVKEPHRWRRQLALPEFVWLLWLDGMRRRMRGGSAA